MATPHTLHTYPGISKHPGSDMKMILDTAHTHTLAASYTNTQVHIHAQLHTTHIQASSEAHKKKSDLNTDSQKTGKLP